MDKYKRLINLHYDTVAAKRVGWSSRHSRNEISEHWMRVHKSLGEESAIKEISHTIYIVENNITPWYCT
jgi:hypothetical protein